MTYCLGILLLVTCVAHAQWHTSLGWGGAGWGYNRPDAGGSGGGGSGGSGSGKRIVDPPVRSQPHSRQVASTATRKPDPLQSLTSPDMSDLTSDCQSDLTVLELLSNIIQEEMVRVQRCLNLTFGVQER